jgi:hypothetical protein
LPFRGHAPAIIKEDAENVLAEVGLRTTSLRGTCSFLVLLAYLLLISNKNVNGHDTKSSGYLG